MPEGPPSALYNGRLAGPAGALPRVDTDAKEGSRPATSAKNLSQMLLDWKRTTQFTGQSLQTADPVNVLYLPATHALHVPPSAPEYPALQVQLIKDELPTGAFAFG